MKKLLLVALGLSAPICLVLAIRSPALGINRFEFGEFKLKRLLVQPSRLVEPAPLTQAHRTDPNCADCAACHALTQGVPTQKCLACHEEIGRRTADALGHHGRDLQGDCITCHIDHVEKIVEFDPDQFNHLRAAFVLEGRHQMVECDQCHETPGGNRYLGLSFASCRDCHRDPHLGSLSLRDCAACHTANDWNKLHSGFDHDTDFGFPLDDLHGAVECAACHATSVYGSTPQTCAQCHADFAGYLEGNIANGAEGQIWPADPHLGLVSCEQCHPGDDGEPTSTTHAQRCATCHTERYANLYLNRSAHLLEMASQVEDEQMRLCLRVGSHNYVEAEKRARTLVEESRGS